MAIPAPLIALLMIVIIGGLAYWIMGLFPLPEPAGRIAQVLLVVILVLALVMYVLLPMLGMGGLRVVG